MHSMQRILIPTKQQQNQFYEDLLFNTISHIRPIVL